MNKFLLILPILLFTCSLQKSETTRWQEQASRVTIIRDDFGVPHIYGKTDADAVFGLLYAQCEDDFPRVERNYTWAIGRLAELHGENELYSDLRARIFMTEDEAVAWYESSPEWLKKLCNAFADGVNFYLYTHPEIKPKLLTRFEPWMTMYFSEGSIGGDIEGVSIRGIKDFYEENKAAVSDIKEEIEFLEEPKGSNGFALSGKLTKSGHAMLLINPHTSFYFRGEVHVVSEEGLNAYGAVTWGQFFVYQGFNEKTGWLHSSTYTDVSDNFTETIEKRNGKLSYKYGSEWRAVQIDSLTLKYRRGDSLLQRTFPRYRTHHGPVTHKTGTKWTTTALMWQPAKSLEQSFTRTKLSGHAEFREMMNMRANSSNNTVYADAEGNIAYYHGNFIPVRDTSFNYTQAVDGSNPQTDWQGLHTVNESITIFNPPNGWIQNCNSTPFSAAAEYSPKAKDYPYYMSRNQENFRGINASRILSAAKEITLEELIELAYNPYLTGFEKVMPALLEAYKNNASKYPALKNPISFLQNWDLTTSKESVAMSLAHFYGMELYTSKNFPMGMSAMDAFNFAGTQLPETERLNLFARAIKKIESDFGTWQIPWGEINRFQRLNGDINVQFDDSKPSIAVGFSTSRWGALAAYGMRITPTTKKIYGTRGNSFVAVVEFGEKLKAKSILAGGQSADPNSAHFKDQAQRYVDVRFKDIAYYREDVQARALKKYHPGE